MTEKITDECPKDDVAFDWLTHAREQGQAQFNSIVEMVALDYESAEQAIHESAFCVEVRSGWVAANEYDRTTGWPKPEEYRILLCSDGPAVQICGELSEHGEPKTAHLEVQDWFTPWTEFHPALHEQATGACAEEILLAYARCFYYV